MSNIRVTYSGLIAFISGIVSVIFGLFFILIVTRSLSPEEYGTWGLLFSIVSYMVISETIFSYWSVRQISRGKNIGKTSILSSSLLSIVILPMFVLYVFFVSENTEAKFEILLLGIILIPVSVISQSLSAINLGYKPHVIGYSQIIFQSIKIPAVFITLLVFDLSVFGIILSILIALLGKIILLFYYAIPKLKDKFNYQTLKYWIKTAWIPLFSIIPNYLVALDIVIYSVITGSVIGIAFYNVSYSIAAIVQHSGTISQALYPKLLAEKNFGGIKKILNQISYFAILLVGISIVFSKPALFALNPLYENAWPIVLVLSFKVSIQAFRTIPLSIITGTEQVDSENNPRFSRLIKSNLFKLPKILIIFNSLYILILVIFLQFFSNSFSELDLVFWWALIGLFIEIPTSLFLWIYSRKYIKISFPISNPLKYLLAISIMIAFFMYSSNFILNYEPSIYDFLPSLLLDLILCVGIYIGITYLFDNDTRKLLTSILNELKSIIPRKNSSS